MRIPLLLVTVLLGACGDKVPEPTPDRVAAPPPKPAAAPEPTALEKIDIAPGMGVEAKPGDRVKVHYTGRLFKNNLKFDSSTGKDPLPFTIGEGGVIKGWDQGVAGMRVGGKRKLIIPSDLAYGAAGFAPKIPPNAALIFDVELVDIVTPDAGAADGG